MKGMVTIMKRKVAVFTSLLLGTPLISASPSENAQTTFDSTRRRIKNIKKSLCRCAAAIFAAAITALSSVIPCSAATFNDKVLKWTPSIDGKIDAAYLQSYYIEHEFETDAEHFWGIGKFEPDENGFTSYNWDVKATTYFLWDENYIYIAIRVIDDDIGSLDDEHWNRAVQKRDAELNAGVNLNWAPYFQDGIQAYFSYKGMNFNVHADAAGRYLTVYKPENFQQQVWCDLYSYEEFEKNASDGLYKTVRSGDGSYIIEFAMPLNINVKDKILKDGGKFQYGLVVSDATSDSGYDYDYALSLEGIFEEGLTLKDIIFIQDHIEYQQGKYSIVLSDSVPDTSLLSQNEESGGRNDNGIGNNGGAEINPSNAQPVGSSGNGSSAGSGNAATGMTNTNGSVQTSDISTAFAAVSFISLFLAVIIRKRR